MAHFKGTENKDVRCPRGPVAPAEVRFRLFSPGSGTRKRNTGPQCGGVRSGLMWKIRLLFDCKSAFAVKYKLKNGENAPQNKRKAVLPDDEFNIVYHRSAALYT